MKKYIFLIFAAALVMSCDSRLDEHLRLLPTDSSIPAPLPVTVTGVRNTPGGAVIKISYPDDDNIRGAVVSYDRNGVKVDFKSSRYVDSLVVEGFPDSAERTVQVSSFNVNEVLSESVPVKISPLTPPIKTVKPTITTTYGGVKVLIEGNEAKADLAVCLLRDEDPSDVASPNTGLAQKKWVEVTTLFTSSNNIRLTRRNIQPVEALFGVYIKDHWGNVTDTTTIVLTPIEEYVIDNKTFKDANLPDDNCKSANNSYYPVQSLWDGSGASATPHFFASDYAPRPCWLTINLGKTAELSRVHTLPRIDYLVWSNAQVRCFEFWGWVSEKNPTGDVNNVNPHGFEDGWVLLGEFEQVKPSGYMPDGSVGDYTSEDREYFNAGNDFEFDKHIWPHANDPIRYLRVVFKDSFETYNTERTSMAVQIGEITPYGKEVK